MKIITPIGSKERFLEMFQGVNKVQLNEVEANTMQTGTQLIDRAFEELKSGQSNVQQTNTQTAGEDNFVEIVAADNNGNQLTFNFKVSSTEGEQDGVYNVGNALLDNFKLQSADTNVDMPFQMKAVQEFNANHSSEIMDVVQQYADFETNTASDDDSTDEMYEDAIKLIDKVPYKKGTEQMQTNAAYADQKPTNPALRVKSPELDSFVSEINLGGAIDGGIEKQYSPDLKRKYILHADRALTRYLGERKFTMDSEEYKGLVKRLALSQMMKISADVNEEEKKKSEYPDQIGSKFKPKNQMPKKKKKPQSVVKISEEPINEVMNSEIGTYILTGLVILLGLVPVGMGIEKIFSVIKNIIGNSDTTILGNLVNKIKSRFNVRDLIKGNVDKNEVINTLSPEEQNFVKDVSTKIGGGNNDVVTEEEEISSETDEFFPITTPLGSEDDRLFVSVVNQGIDSHLEGFTKSKFDKQGNRRVFNFHTSELPILLRRLEDVGTEEALSWKSDIENYEEDSMYESEEKGEEEVDSIEAMPFEDSMGGGLADDKQPSDFCPKQLAMGLEVEMEHTDDPKVALEIAMDHLMEIPDYYTHLNKMEADAEGGIAGGEDADGNPIPATDPDFSKMMGGGEEITIKLAGDDDSEGTDELLGYKPHNVNDYTDEEFDYAAQEREYHDSEDMRANPQEYGMDDEPENDEPISETDDYEEYQGEVGDRFEDAEGNQFTVSNKVQGGVSLRGQGGEKETDTGSLSFMKKLGEAKEETKPLITEAQLKVAKNVLKNRSNELTKKEAVRILMLHNI